MAYLELSKEAYNDIILAAGMKGSKVARVCEAQGVWSPEAQDEAPDNVAEPEKQDAELDPDGDQPDPPESPHQMTMPPETSDD